MELDGAATVLVRGELDIATAPALGTCLLDVTRSLPAGADLVIDAQGLSFVDAAGLAVIIRFRNELRAAGSDVRVTSAGPWVSRIFELCGLEEMLGRAKTQGVD